MWLRCLSLGLQTEKRKGFHALGRTFVTSTREQTRQVGGLYAADRTRPSIDRVKGRGDGYVSLGTLRLLRH
jgi:hypothetical protein